jgi:hypothetical protein
VIVSELDFRGLDLNSKSNSKLSLLEKYEWDRMYATITTAVEYWTPASFQVTWFPVCYPQVEPAMISKEYSPGRYRYFNLPLDPFMTSEASNSSHVSILVKKFNK